MGGLSFLLVLSSCDSWCSYFYSHLKYQDKKLFNAARPFIDHFETEDDFEYILEYLADVPPEKQEAVCQGMLPLVAGFEKGAETAPYTGLMLRDLGKADVGDIPGYIRALNDIAYNPKSARSTLNALKKVMPPSFLPSFPPFKRSFFSRVVFDK